MCASEWTYGFVRPPPAWQLLDCLPRRPLRRKVARTGVDTPTLRNGKVPATTPLTYNISPKKPTKLGNPYFYSFALSIVFVSFDAHDVLAQSAPVLTRADVCKRGKRRSFLYILKNEPTLSRENSQMVHVWDKRHTLYTRCYSDYRFFSYQKTEVFQLPPNGWEK